ncbi:putative effector protein [Ceratobasidium theobromae]|uniref:Putative effector protein n=1 Tax=Ceratobasidium theobromae TaxID=1582974 RepID=A0A5N5QNV8_9AGAM|nr:putative effector protein [Ceratobasidium theobromae]
MMLSRSLSIFVACAALTLAAPVELLPGTRDVPTETCTKRTSGYLTGKGGQKFAISKDGKHVVYAGSSSTSSGLEVEFQECNPNFTQWSKPGNGPHVGHIYVPAVGKCLHVPSYEAGNTYSLLLDKCYYSHDSSQFALYFMQDGSNYYWSGATTSDGSSIQGKEDGCKSGLYGYQGAVHGAAKKSGQATVACNSNPNVMAFMINA